MLMCPSLLLLFQNGLLNYEVFQTQEESVTLPLTPFSSTSYLNWTFNILPAALQPHMVHCCHSPDCIFDTQALSNLQQTKRPPPGAAHEEGVTPPPSSRGSGLEFRHGASHGPAWHRCCRRMWGKRLQVGQELIDYFSDKQKSADLEHDQTMLDKLVDGLATSWVNSSNYKVSRVQRMLF